MTAAAVRPFRLLLAVLLLATALPGAAAAAGAHQFGFRSIEGEDLPLAGFAGKAVMVVNTASFCGFTDQYAGLVEVWRRYRERGLVVLGVPSNDFGNQEPGREAEIREFCEVNFDVDFPMTEKQVVTGRDAHPFYRWAKDELGQAAAPRWNFHKYLVAPDGQLVGWFPTRTEPTAPEVSAAIEAILPR